MDVNEIRYRAHGTDGFFVTVERLEDVPADTIRIQRVWYTSWGTWLANTSDGYYRVVDGELVRLDD